MVNYLEKNKACLAMIFVQLAYAGMALFSKAAIAKGMNPYIFVAYRQIFATIALAPFAFLLDRKKADPVSYKLMCKVFLISLFGITLSLNLYVYAINFISATFAAASVNTIPVLTFLVAITLRIESVSIRHFYDIAKVVGSAVGLSGAMVFAFVKGPQVKFMNWFAPNHEAIPSMNFSSKDWGKGCLLMLLANFAWASWLVMQAPLMKQYSAKLRLTTLQCLFSCLQSLVWAMAMERDISLWKLEWDLNLLSVAYCGIVVTGVTYWLQLWAVEKKGPLFAAAFTPLALIITAIISMFLWKEILHWGSICGGILLAVGLYCVLWGKNKEIKEKATNEQSDSKEEIIV
ncbi:WAT1-related protein [Abeliophyllum distichum]|uniref:WAT1-related protein n=1 Tax=Abeliophyllum distichum TaxID=126358 RepID=A0ABD1SV18_9LAMI